MLSSDQSTNILYISLWNLPKFCVVCQWRWMFEGFASFETRCSAGVHHFKIFIFSLVPLQVWDICTGVGWVHTPRRNIWSNICTLCTVQNRMSKIPHYTLRIFWTGEGRFHSKCFVLVLTTKHRCSFDTNPHSVQTKNGWEDINDCRYSILARKASTRKSISSFKAEDVLNLVRYLRPHERALLITEVSIPASGNCAEWYHCVVESL